MEASRPQDSASSAHWGQSAAGAASPGGTIRAPHSSRANSRFITLPHLQIWYHKNRRFSGEKVWRMGGTAGKNWGGGPCRRSGGRSRRGRSGKKSGEPAVRGSPLWQQSLDYLALWDLEWLGATYWPFSFLTSLPSLTSSLGV